MKKTALFTTAAIVAMAGVATAGTLKTGSAGTSVATFKVAKEAVEGQTAAAPLGADLSTFIVPSAIGLTGFTGGVVVTPTQIPLTTLTDGIMNFSASAGKWDVTLDAVAGDQLQICDDTGTPTLVYKTGSGTNAIVFDKGNGTTALGTAIAGTISNGKNYAIMWGNAGGDCLTAPGGTSSIALTVPPGTTSTALTVATGIATTQQIHDTATAPVLAVGYQLSGTVSKQVGLQVDFENAFSKLFNPIGPVQGLTSDTLDVKVTMGTKDLDATTGAGDKVITTITVSDVAGLKTTGTATVQDITLAPKFDTGNVTACTDLNTTTKKIVCTSTADGALADGDEQTLEYTINVDGTAAISEKTFTVATEYDFTNAQVGGTNPPQDRTVANGNALIAGADAGTWRFRGTTVYVPLVKEGNGANTFIKLQSKANAAVRGLVLCSDGVSRAVELGTITAGVPKAITSTDIVTALGGTGTVDAVAGYAMTLSITSDKANVFGYANTVDGAGNAKRIPLSIESGVSN